MKLIGNLEKQVDNAVDISEKRNLIEKAGMKLTDDELKMVAGGAFATPAPYPIPQMDGGDGYMQGADHYS